MTPSISQISNNSSERGPDSGNSEQSDQVRQLFKLDSISGKGKALIALHHITPGTLLISEPPLLTTDVILNADTIEQDLARHLRTLSRTAQRAFLSLHNNYPGKNPLQNIIRSNGYPLGPGSDVGGVFENISRINHSCLPNAVQAWNAQNREETVYAVRDIQPGTEITLSYHAGGPSTVRKALLKENFGFDCACELCSLPPSELKASDGRLIRAQSLDASIGDSATVRASPGKVLKNCKSLLGIFQQEGIKDDRLARLWYDCFQVCNFHSDEARAATFLGRYVDAKKISSGSDGSDVLEMEPFVKEPKKHDSFGLKATWKTSVGQVPAGLSEVDFEKWLWRE